MRKATKHSAFWAVMCILVLQLTYQPKSADANIVTYTFSGNVTSLSGWSADDAQVGDLFDGIFVFEMQPGDNGFFSNYFSQFDVTLNTTSGAKIYNAASANAFLADNSDIFQLSAPSGGGLFSTGLVLQGGTTGFDSTNVSLPLVLAGFSSPTLRLRDTSSTDIRGTITALTLVSSVPEPTSLILLGVGMVMTMRRRRHKS